MERLWSPWRSQYIESFKTQDEAPGCVFCSALGASDDADVFLIHRGVHSFIVMNLYPYNAGHLLVLPNKHAARIDSLTPDEKTELMDMIALGAAIVEKGLACHGYNVGANFGRVAGAGITEHLHMHIVPRWNGDTNFMTVFHDVRIISEEMKKTHAKLLEAKHAILG